MFIIINNTESREFFRTRLEIILKFVPLGFLFAFIFFLYQAGKSFVNFYVNGSDNSFETGFCSFSFCCLFFIWALAFWAAGADDGVFCKTT